MKKFIIVRQKSNKYWQPLLGGAWTSCMGSAKRYKTLEDAEKAIKYNMHPVFKCNDPLKIEVIDA